MHPTMRSAAPPHRLSGGAVPRGTAPDHPGFVPDPTEHGAYLDAGRRFNGCRPGIPAADGGWTLPGRRAVQMGALEYLWSVASRPAPDEASWATATFELGGVGVALGLLTMAMGHALEAIDPSRDPRDNPLWRRGCILMLMGLELLSLMAGRRFQAAMEADRQADCVEDALRQGRLPTDPSRLARVENEKAATRARIKDLSEFHAKPVDTHIREAKARYGRTAEALTQRGFALEVLNAGLFLGRHASGDRSHHWLIVNAAVAATGMLSHVVSGALRCVGPRLADRQAASLNRRHLTAPEELRRLRALDDQLHALR